MSNLLKLITSIALTFSAGGVGSLFTASSVSTWYETLKKPPFTPPGWIFGPAWTILYFVTAISFYLIWSKTNFQNQKNALVFFLIQLILNAFWSIIFFGLRQPLYAFIEISTLWVAILLTLISFYRIDNTAGLLLLPYIAWVTFAAILNFSIIQLN